MQRREKPKGAGNPKARRRTVMAFGTFDILHPGHVSYLKQAAELGDELVVVIATDANVEKIKGRPPVYSQEQRRGLVESLRIVDKVIVGVEDDMISSVERIRPEVVALGYDQQPGNEVLERKLHERGINARIMRLKAFRPEIYKSSKIKERIRMA